MKRAVLGIAIALLALPAPAPGQDALAERTEAAFIASFAGGEPSVLIRTGLQDEVQRLCSEHRNAPPAGLAQLIEGAQRAAIRYPAKLMGDWREGERIAADFTGLRYDDKAGQLHVRSASRLGRRDFGVNRSRVEQLRSMLEKRIKS